MASGVMLRSARVQSQQFNNCLYSFLEHSLGSIYLLEHLTCIICLIWSSLHNWIHTTRGYVQAKALGYIMGTSYPFWVSILGLHWGGKNLFSQIHSYLLLGYGWYFMLSSLLQVTCLIFLHKPLPWGLSLFIVLKSNCIFTKIGEACVIK